MSDALYQQAIKDLARRAHGSGELASPDRRIRLDNPLCGDRIDLELTLDAEGRILDLAHRTRGCLLCLASASIVGLHARGADRRTVDAIHRALAERLETGGEIRLVWPELAAFEPVAAYPSRHGCVLLPLRTLQKALEAH